MKKALKVNLVFSWIFIVLIIGVGFTNGNNYGATILKYMVLVGLVGTIIYFIPFNEKVKGTILVGIPAVSAFTFSVIQGGVVEMFYIYILSLGMQSLYLNKKLMIGYGSIISLVLIITYFVSPTLLVGTNAQIIELIMPMGTFIFVYIVLVVLTTFEQEKALIFNEKEDRNKEALKQFKTVFEEISLSINRFEEKLNNCSEKIETGKEGAQRITGSMGGLVTSTGTAATILTNISNSASLSRENVGEMYETATYIDQYFKDAMNDIRNCKRDVVKLSQQVDKMKQVINSDNETKQQFVKQAEQVSGFVDGIADITSKTNLLALDASIEAVRVGGNGEKFASVAERIRILSEESGDFINRIRKIIAELIKPDDATMNEDDIIKSFDKKFDHVEKSFNIIGEKIAGELSLINDKNDEFNMIDNDIHNITVVFEENATRLEEVSIRMELQKNTINEAANLMTEIMTIKNSLNKLVNNVEKQIF